jgi:hypothetical protein
MTKQKIQDYLLKHPIDRSQQNPYESTATALGIDKEQVRAEWRALRRKGLVEVQTNYIQVGNVQTPPPTWTATITDGGSFRIDGSNASISRTVNNEIRNELDLADACDIDLKEWTITSWECKSYNAWIKNKAGEIESQPKFSVYAKMKRRELDSDPALQKEELLKQLFTSAPEIQFVDLFISDDDSPVKDCLYEVSIPDAHFGKLAWKEESGDDYDLKIASERYSRAVNELLSRVNLERVERILFPIGNDMINIDSNANTTTSGTPQQVDGRFPKIIQVVKNILIDTINKLGVIAPVDVLVVPGNHDYHTMFMIGEILEAYYSNTERVTVLNSPNPRKYYQYGLNGFQYTHGNEEKHQELGLIFATENPKLWAGTKYRVAKLGHLHKTKKLNFISTDEHQGFQVEILPSLSGTDLWHKKKGYMSLKAAKSYLYHREYGKIAEFTHNLDQY